jgi:hypothetical protein
MQALHEDEHLTQDPLSAKKPYWHGLHIPLYNYPSRQDKQLILVQVVQLMNLLVHETQLMPSRVSVSEGQLGKHIFL